MKLINRDDQLSQADIYDIQDSSQYPYTTGMTSVRGLPDNLVIQFDCGVDEDDSHFAVQARILDLNTWQTTCWNLKEGRHWKYLCFAPIPLVAIDGDSRWMTQNQAIWDLIYLSGQRIREGILC